MHYQHQIPRRQRCHLSWSRGAITLRQACHGQPREAKTPSLDRRSYHHIPFGLSVGTRAWLLRPQGRPFPPDRPFRNSCPRSHPVRLRRESLVVAGNESLAPWKGLPILPYPVHPPCNESGTLLPFLKGVAPNTSSTSVIFKLPQPWPPVRRSTPVTSTSSSAPLV
jgi:hypothetical protein